MTPRKPSYVRPNKIRKGIGTTPGKIVKDSSLLLTGEFLSQLGDVYMNTADMVSV